MPDNTRLRRERMEKKKTLFEVAQELHIYLQTLSSIERRKLAASEKARRSLCDFYELPENELFDEWGRAI